MAVGRGYLNTFQNISAQGFSKYFRLEVIAIKWLLTPPGTPLFSSSEGSESKPSSVAPRRSSMARSTSTTKVVSRISVSQSESYHSSRPTRSRSVTRPSISSSQHNTSSSNRSSSILNTSSAFVSSYTRPSSPIIRTPPVARPSTPLALRNTIALLNSIKSSSCPHQLIN
ncbi:hypothetical protein OIU84_011017 [Salix udensis]|uniref:Uncharacterized protein n=1 Tax=Salix udensis TaxID=889485 RepID=A0AAD6JMF0_9ROSI|nr:hypothetical protein OIU84_011017 [Salix udensis]